MAQQDNRSRQRGGSQQEAYSQQNRQQGWNDSARQPQGDYGDWRREQDFRGGYRDDPSSSGWRSRSDPDQSGQRAHEQRDQGSRFQGQGYGQGGQQSQWSDYGDYSRDYAGDYGQYGMRDRDEDRYGQFGGHGQDRERFNRPSGLDRDYRGAGYAGPGGYGGGYGGSYSGSQSGYSGRGSQEQQFDPDYSQWRREQMRALDDDYDQWRQDRFKKFSDEFSAWRSTRQQTAGTGKTEPGSSSGKQNKDNS